MYLIKIEGRNVYEFLKRLVKENIEILKIEYQDIHHMKILISKEDYIKLKKKKTTYKITCEKMYGPSFLKTAFKKQFIFLIALACSFIFLFILSNRITEIEVIHSDANIRTLLTETLEKKGIKKGSFVKSYEELEKIKKEVLENYKDKIEWLEIKRTGTKYTVRVEERILSQKKEDEYASDIVSNSYAIIKSIKATKGDIVKNIEDYVKPGDILITGEIKLNEETKNQIHSEGEVYGEVWYQVTVEYPYFYEEIIETGKKKKVYVFNFLNKKIEFTTKHYKEKKIQKKTILKHNVLPISLTYETQTEVTVKKETYKKEEAIEKALEEVRKKVESSLQEKEYIISIKKLKVEENNSKIILETFVTVYKNIGVSKKIEVQNSEE
jgi:similar to stage IV sporulation protein